MILRNVIHALYFGSQESGKLLRKSSYDLFNSMCSSLYIMSL